MLISRRREKLINAIIYFAENTRACGKTKLFKLLYFLDFEHYKEIGRSVTGLDYFAWKMGPVPRDLYEELAHPADDMSEAVAFQKKPVKKGTMLLPVPTRAFEPRHFTRRELAIMERLANEFRDKNADEMIEETHFENLPWHQVYEVEGRRQAQIPYEYALRKAEREEVESIARDGAAMRDHYR